jgi:hypothetical protein
MDRALCRVDCTVGIADASHSIGNAASVVVVIVSKVCTQIQLTPYLSSTPSSAVGLSFELFQTCHLIIFIHPLERFTQSHVEVIDLIGERYHGISSRASLGLVWDCLPWHATVSNHSFSVQ